MTTTGVWAEVRKLPAFFRRDLLTALSYRTAFVLDWGNLAVQLLLFSLIGRLVDPGALAGSGSGSYIEFTAVGIALASFMQMAMSRATSTVREEQLMGTLESVLLTPTRPVTFSLGSVVYDLAYVPLRTVIFLTVASALFDLGFAPSGIAGIVAILFGFIPFVWGLGMMAAGFTLTIRRASVVAGLVGLALTVGSNTYFPVEVLPSWLRPVAELNPLTVSLEAARRTLTGGGWGPVAEAITAVLPLAALTMVLGVLVLRWALHHERARGTLGQY